MDSNPLGLAKALLPKVPSLLSTALFHTVGLTPNAKKWDLKTELVVTLIRSLLDSPKPSPISKQQRNSLKDPGIRGPLWISKVTIPKPEEEDVRRVLVEAVDAMKEGEEIYTVPEIASVEAEWTGWRAGVEKDRERLDLTEEQHYERLMKEVESDVTVLYFHGGAYFLMDPCTHRGTCAKLARLTAGRCLSVRYRLAPQHAFPSALLDGLVSYLSLLSPPPGSYYKPVQAKHIVFAGDSAGGNLAICLLQLILQLHRSSPTNPPTIRFHGRDVEVPLPAGVAPNSGWYDVARSMPSIYSNAKYDYLPPPLSNKFVARFPKCELWPTNPPRGDIFCDISMFLHPLVSPVIAKDWRGACPVRMNYGTEMLLDEGKVLAKRIANQGGIVIWEEYEAMPHCFNMIFEDSKAGKVCFESTAKFMRDVVEEKSLETSGKFIAAKTCKETVVDVKNLDAPSDEEVEKRIRDVMEKRAKGEEPETKMLPKL